MPNEPAPVTDVEAETWEKQANWVLKQPSVSGGSWADTMLRLLADRTRDKERIGELEKALRHRSIAYHAVGKHAFPWGTCPLCADECALLEVPDGE